MEQAHARDWLLTFASSLGERTWGRPLRWTVDVFAQTRIVDVDSEEAAVNITLRGPAHLLAIVVLAQAGANVYAQAPFASAAAARELTYALDRSGLNAIAVADPEEPGRFVAALYIPGSQLLVVSADHPSVDGIKHRLAKREYREVYLDLQGTPAPQNKLFVQDAGADGVLSALPERGAVDILYEDGVRQTLFNGDSKGQNLTSAEYDAALARADARYARLLMLLASAVDQIAQPPKGGA
jgi:hypothetical protein